MADRGGRAVVTVPVTARLADGMYTVSWPVISADGDVVGSQFRFAAIARDLGGTVALYVGDSDQDPCERRQIQATRERVARGGG